jgi:hypothetical protein
MSEDEDKQWKNYWRNELGLNERERKERQEAEKKRKKREEEEFQKQVEESAQKTRDTLSILSDERWDKFLAEVVKPLLEKLDYAKERIHEEIAQRNNWVQYIYNDYENAIKRAVSKEFQRFLETSFKKKEAEIDKSIRENLELIDDLTEESEALLMAMAKKLGKEKQLKQLIEKSNE